MRRSIFLSLVIFLLFSGLYAAESESPKTKLSSQFSTETFTWEGNENADSYLVEIRVLKDEKWEIVYEKKVDKTQVSVPLMEGNYQIVITPVNILGKKGESSAPVFFKVITNTTPYILEPNQPKEAKKAPLLLVKKKNKKLMIDSVKSDIKTPEGYETNVFTIRGKNIFYEDTVFELCKIEKKDKEGEKILLNVEKRDETAGVVYVSIPGDKIKAGDYKIVVTNKDGEKDEVKIRVDSEVKRERFFSSLRFAIAANVNADGQDDTSFEWYNLYYKTDFMFVELTRLEAFGGVSFVCSDVNDNLWSPELALYLGFDILSGVTDILEFVVGVDVGFALWDWSSDSFGENNLFIEGYVGLRAKYVDAKFGLKFNDNLNDGKDEMLFFFEIGGLYTFR